MTMQHRALGNAAIAVLAALASGYKYGFDIMDHTGLKSGSVYRALSRLEELRLTSSKWEGARIAVQEKRPRRRYYEITDAGHAELAATRENLVALVDKLAPEHR